LAVEPDRVDGRLELCIAARPPRQPPGEALEVEQGAHGGVGVVHAQEELDEAVDVGVDDAHVAVVVGRGLGDDPRRPGREDTLLGEQEVVGVDHAGGVHPAVPQRFGGGPFTSDVVAVQPDADLEAVHPDVGAVQQAEREQGGLGRVDRSGPHGGAGEIGDRRGRGVGPDHDDR